jgi:apolipoprotein N-acyltransferase
MPASSAHRTGSVGDEARRGKRLAAPRAHRYMPRSMRGSLALTIVSALLYGASFPPWSVAPLAWVALVPLLAAVVRVSPLRAACCGVIWGVVAAYTVGWWFPGMVSSYFERPGWFGWTAFVAVSVGLAGGYFAAFAAWLSWLARRRRVGPLAISAGWGACELTRARLWVGDPWALSAYSQAGFSPLLQLADVAGPYGIGMLIAAVNAVVASFIVRRLRSPRPLVAALAVMAALGGTLAYGVWRLGQDFSTGAPIRVAVVQGALEPDVATRPETQRRAVEHYLTLTAEGMRFRPELVVWPEYAVNFYLQENTPEGRQLLAGVDGASADLILGAPSYRITPSGTEYQNSVFLVRDGAIASRYDKIQLLPWAERTVLGQQADPLGVFYTPGERQEPLRARAAAVAPFLCFEAMYPELLHPAVGRDVDLLANLSNDAWFGAIAPARQHLDMAAMRAIEARRYLLRAASTGFSAIIDPHGRMIAVSEFGKPAVLTGVVHRPLRESPYQGWGRIVPWLAVGCVLALSIGARRAHAASACHGTNAMLHASA